VDIVICAERASRYIEEECIRRLGIGGSRIQVGKRVFVRVKKEFGEEMKSQSK